MNVPSKSITFLPVFVRLMFTKRWFVENKFRVSHNREFQKHNKRVKIKNVVYRCALLERIRFNAGRRYCHLSMLTVSNNTIED